MRHISIVLPWCLALSLVSILFNPFISFAVHEEALTDIEEEEVPFDVPVEEIVEYLAPMNELDLFPCSDCHDEEWEVDPTRRELDEPHDEIPGKYANHDSENRWCLDCHSPDNREKLRLINGTLIEFNEYYKLCEQCHKRVYREWKMGVHGKRTGHWNGEKEYMHCAQCHNPHDPPFKPLKPMPAPRKPGDVRVLSSN
jgi:hypothetical protein